jgi:hypothetical protein
MIDRNPSTGKATGSYALGLAAASIAILALVVTGGLAVRTLAAAAPSVANERAVTNDTPAVYFPAQFVNQATEIEPMPPTF